MAVITPCYQCQSRCAQCHSHCEEYAAWVAERKRQHEAARKGNDADAHTISVIQRIAKRTKAKVRGQR